MQLSINHFGESVKITSLQEQASDAITSILQHNEATGEEQEATESDLLVSWVPAKCEICMQKLREIKDKDHRRLKRLDGRNIICIECIGFILFE